MFLSLEASPGLHNDRAMDMDKNSDTEEIGSQQRMMALLGLIRRSQSCRFEWSSI